MMFALIIEPDMYIKIELSKLLGIKFLAKLHDQFKDFIVRVYNKM